MKRLVVFVAVTNLAGCTTLQPVNGTAADIQGRIASGQLLKAGDRVRVVTTSADTRDFTITDVRDGVISGRDVTIPVAQVAEVQMREHSVTKTVLLVGGLILVAAVVAYASASSATSLGFEQ